MPSAKINPPRFLCTKCEWWRKADKSEIIKSLSNLPCWCPFMTECWARGLLCGSTHLSGGRKLSLSRPLLNTCCLNSPYKALHWARHSGNKNMKITRILTFNNWPSPRRQEAPCQVYKYLWCRGDSQFGGVVGGRLVGMEAVRGGRENVSSRSRQVAGNVHLCHAARSSDLPAR